MLLGRLAGVAGLFALATVSAQHYEALPSVGYHAALHSAGDKPMLVAYLNESSSEFEDDEEEFELAAEAFHCVAGGGTHVMLSGTDQRALFIAREDNLALPALSLFVNGKRSDSFDGAEWIEQSLLDWVYMAVAGIKIVRSVADVNAAAEGGKVALAVVDRFCAPDAVEFVRAAIAHRQKHGSFMNAALTTNGTISDELDLRRSRGVTVVERRAEFGYNQINLPPGMASMGAAELESWLTGVMGVNKKQRGGPGRRSRRRGQKDEM